MSKNLLAWFPYTADQKEHINDNDINDYNTSNNAMIK